MSTITANTPAPAAAAKMPPQIPYIIGNEGCERFSFYGMKAILFVYLMHFLTGSGMDKALAEQQRLLAAGLPDRVRVKAEIEAEVGIKPWWALECFTDPFADVRQSINRLRNSPFVKHKDHISGFVYDVHDGRLHEV